MLLYNMRSNLLFIVAVVLLLAGPALAQLSIEDLENLKEIADFFGGAASDQFPNTKPEVRAHLCTARHSYRVG